MVLHRPGAIVHPTVDRGLYFPVNESEQPEQIETTLKLIPYYAWANRAASPMQVWIPDSKA